MSEFPKDRNGKTLKVGSKVKVIKLDENLFLNLPADEIENLKSMIGEVFEIKELEGQRGGWIEKWWYFSDGRSMGHEISLAGHELELVEE
ncbi:MAG: hypothetical protein KDI65_08665 [Alphaproteobacteria bacterium]|nr:hypothetical protein [Alphaproteobacteria bacterium]